MLKLTWFKCGKESKWCTFENVDLSTVDTTGVYVIWHGGEKPRVVYVGQGVVADRIAQHRNDKRITSYADKKLFVTGADVSVFQRDGVERYLADRYSPLVGDAHPNVAPIAVNGPWD